MMGYANSRCSQDYKMVIIRILFDRQIKLEEGEDSITFGDPDVI